MKPSTFPPPAAGILGVCVVVLAAIRFGESLPVTDVTGILAGPSGEAPPADMHVVLVFQIADCWKARHDLARWSEGQRVAAAAPFRPSSVDSEVRVVGVLVGPKRYDEAKTQAILAESGLRFPIRRDRLGRTEALVRSLGYRRTPVVLVFDGEGRLSSAGPADWLQPAVVLSGALRPPASPAP